MHLANDAEAQSCLSDTEHEFVSGYVNLYQQHMDRSVWEALDTTAIPENLKDISKTPSLGVPLRSAHGHRAEA